MAPETLSFSIPFTIAIKLGALVPLWRASRSPLRPSLDALALWLLGALPEWRAAQIEHWLTWARVHQHITQPFGGAA